MIRVNSFCEHENKSILSAIKLSARRARMRYVCTLEWPSNNTVINDEGRWLDLWVKCVKLFKFLQTRFTSQVSVRYHSDVRLRQKHDKFHTFITFAAQIPLRRKKGNCWIRNSFRVFIKSRKFYKDVITKTLTFI